jgi:hypothetical protein
MHSTASELHIIGAVDDPEATVGRALETAESGAVLLDMSMKQFTTTPSYVEEIRKQAKSKKCTYVNAQTYADQVAEPSRNDYVDWLAETANLPLYGDKSIKECFVYDEEVSAWWFTKMSMKHPQSHPFRWTFYQIHVLNLMEEDNIDKKETYIWVDYRPQAKALKSALPVEEKKVETKYSKSTNRNLKGKLNNTLKSTKWGRIFLSLWHLGAGIICSVFRLLREWYFSWRTLRPLQDNHPCSDPKRREDPLVLIQTNFPTSWEQSVADLEKPQKGVNSHDIYFGDSPWRLRSEGYDVCWLPMLSSRNYSEWKNVGDNQKIPDVLPFAEVSIPDIFRICYHKIGWASTYVWVFLIKGAGAKLRYKNIPMSYWFKEELNKICRLNFPLEIEKYRSVKESIQADNILYRNEFYPGGRAVTAGFKGTCNLIGVQHGLVNHDHTVYKLDNDNVKKPVESGSYNHVKYMPVPDYFAAFGEYYSDLFKRWSGYPYKNVVPTGGLRHDMLVECYRRVSSAKNPEAGLTKQDSLRKTLGIPTECYVLLLCTSAKLQVEGQCRKVLNAVQKIENKVHVAVKLHQYHGGNSIVKDVASTCNFRSISVHEKGVYPLMAVSNVMVGGMSTTILEALLLKTPAVVVARKVPYPFENEELAQVVDSADEMKEALKRIIGSNSDPIPNPKYHLNNTDGKACYRLAQFIQQLK